MGTFLEALGFLFLLVVLLLAGVLLLVRLYVRRIRSALLGFSLQPSRIHLEDDPRPGWLDSPQAAARVFSFRDMGFQPGTPYRIPGLKDARLCSFFKADEGLLGVLYHHPDAGCWVDLSAHLDDGTELTVTDAPADEPLATRPGVVRIHRPLASMAALYERLKTEQAGRTTRPFTQSDFAMRFERVYEQDMAWRNDQGGVTREQVRRMARINKVDLTEDEIEDAHREIKRDELWSWHDECLTQYAEETPAFVRDWSDQDGQFLIVTPKAAPGAFLDYISDLVELDEEELARLESQVQRGMSAGELFDQINGEREPGRKARRVGSVYYPVAADIWWAPDETPESAPNGLKRV